MRPSGPNRPYRCYNVRQGRTCGKLLLVAHLPEGAWAEAWCPGCKTVVIVPQAMGERPPESLIGVKS